MAPYILMLKGAHMITADFHVHSNFSGDGKFTMEEMINQAIKLGLKTLCFTDHIDYDYPKEYEYSFEFNVDEYVHKLELMKDKYQSQIEILTGIELGLQTHIVDSMEALIKSYPFDFVIGSLHLIDNIDPYYPQYWEGRTQEAAIMRCFEAMKECCSAYQGFNVLGHIDYIVRYAPSNKQQYKEYSYPYYADIIDEILKIILKHGKGIEVNTSGYKYGLGHPHPKTEILKRYKELGGEIITIGSDAHKPEHLSYDFSSVKELLQSLGYSYYTIFKAGKPIMIKL